MIFDDLGWYLIIFRNHDFYDFTRFCHLHHLEESASHPPPSTRGSAPSYQITWLEELASESNTIQAQEDIVCQGILQAISR